VKLIIRKVKPKQLIHNLQDAPFFVLIEWCTITVAEGKTVHELSTGIGYLFLLFALRYEVLISLKRYFSKITGKGLHDTNGPARVGFESDIESTKEEKQRVTSWGIIHCRGLTLAPQPGARRHPVSFSFSMLRGIRSAGEVRFKSL